MPQGVCLFECVCAPSGHAVVSPSQHVSTASRALYAAPVDASGWVKMHSQQVTCDHCAAAVVCAVCCSMSMVIEDIVPLDPNDPSVVTAAITSVVETDLPFTQLGEGDNRVSRLAKQCMQARINSGAMRSCASSGLPTVCWGR